MFSDEYIEALWNSK